MPFKAGDLVRLKSGGPKMTVTSTRRDDGNVAVTWFPTEQERNAAQAVFLPETLEDADTRHITINVGEPENQPSSS